MLWFRRFRREDAAHLKAGRWGEKQAAGMLRQNGYRVLGQRVRVGRRDELDIIARDGETLVFVEVKTRRDERFGRPISAVHREKKRALSRAAIRYMKRLREKPATFRFDVVEVIGTPDGGQKNIRHIQNAFPLDRRYRIRW